MESFFGTLKSEFFYLNKFNNLNELETGLGDYIHYYNYSRIRLKLSGLSPAEYRTQARTDTPKPKVIWVFQKCSYESVSGLLAQMSATSAASNRTMPLTASICGNRSIAESARAVKT